MRDYKGTLFLINHVGVEDLNSAAPKLFMSTK